jgi:hypothetical protein
VRLIEQRPTRTQTVNVESDTRLRLLGERTELFDDLGLQFDLTREHSENAISSNS